ncbi:MAG: hypothetical protein JRF33_04835 [Deltaproteobacteria bacterium]|nr:hypothetical protein [Deltaproteobacteria bacterium]
MKILSILFATWALSAEYWQNLSNDLRLVSEKLADWAGQRWQDLSQPGAWPGSTEGTGFQLRLALAVALIIGIVLVRKRISGLPSRIIRRLKAWPFFAKRIGLMVRLAGFFQATLPPAAVMAATYAAMALVGFYHPEVRIFEVAFRWILLYVLGRQILLGLTRQVSRGRPAFIAVKSESVTLLRLTYGRLGLVMALAAIIGTWSRDWLGTGSLSALVSYLVWIWLGGWMLWAAFAWRRTLAEIWLEGSGKQSQMGRLAAWMSTHRAGALLSPLALLWLICLAGFRLIKRALIGGGVFSYFRARALKRLARKEDDKQDDAKAEDLPERYLTEFPLHPIQGEDGPVLLDRDEQLKQVLDQLQHWQVNRTDGSLVLLGEKGMGKTTFLSLVERSITSYPVLRHTFSRKLLDEKALLDELGPALGAADAGSMGVLTSRLNKEADRVIVLDETHNLFLRTVDGYKAYDALVRLVNYTSEHVFWILSFNNFAWDFLNQSRSRAHYFRRLLKLPNWSTAELQDLVARRSMRAGMKLRFDEVLLHDERGAEDFQLIESAEGYFRLLKESSCGNPRVATWLWLRSLRKENEDTLGVGLLRQPKLEASKAMENDLLFALAAVCQHENLSVDELRQVLNCSQDFAGFAVRYLSEGGFFEPKHTDPNRITLSAKYYPQVLRRLRSKHLLKE